MPSPAFLLMSVIMMMFNAVNGENSSIRPEPPMRGPLLRFEGVDQRSNAGVTLDSVRVISDDGSLDTNLVGGAALQLSDLTGVATPPAAMPVRCSVESFGNPFASHATIRVAMPVAATGDIVISDMAGRAVLQARYGFTAGVHTFELESGSLPAGVYLFAIRTAESSVVHKLVKSGRASGAAPVLVHTGATMAASGLPKAGAVARTLTFVAYARGYRPATIRHAPGRDTTYTFLMAPPAAPYATMFMTGTPHTINTNVAVLFGFAVADPDGNLARVLIDFEGDGVFDDSTDAAGAEATSFFMRSYALTGTYMPLLRVVDATGLFSDSHLEDGRFIYVSRPPVVTSFTISPDSVIVGQTDSAFITVTDPDGDLASVKIDYAGDKSFVDSVAISGAAATVGFSWAYLVPGSYRPRVVVSDHAGNLVMGYFARDYHVRSAPNQVVITSVHPSLSPVPTKVPVTFDVAGKDPLNNFAPVMVKIDFENDGAWEDSTVVTPGADTVFHCTFTTTYQEIRDYNVQVYARNVANLVATYLRHIDVHGIYQTSGFGCDSAGNSTLYQGMTLAWGDLNTHTTYSADALDDEGCTATPEQACMFARDSSLLDFVAITDHAETGPPGNATQQKWDAMLAQEQAVEAASTRPFVIFPGFEYSKNDPVSTAGNGSKVIICEDFTHVPDRGRGADTHPLPTNLWSWLYSTPAADHFICIPTHPAQGADSLHPSIPMNTDWNIPFTAPCQSLVESYSRRGSSEYRYQDETVYHFDDSGSVVAAYGKWLRTHNPDYKLGIVGSTDTHWGKPGDLRAVPENIDHRLGDFRGAITGVWVPSVARSNIWNGLNAKRTIVSTGPRSRIEFTVKFGDTLVGTGGTAYHDQSFSNPTSYGEANLHFKFIPYGNEKIRRVQFLLNNSPIATFDSTSHLDLTYMITSNYAYLRARVYFEGRSQLPMNAPFECVWTSPIWIEKR